MVGGMWDLEDEDDGPVDLRDLLSWDMPGLRRNPRRRTQSERQKVAPVNFIQALIAKHTYR